MLSISACNPGKLLPFSQNLNPSILCKETEEPVHREIVSGLPKKHNAYVYNKIRGVPSTLPCRRDFTTDRVNAGPIRVHSKTADFT
jgi:hypothetical protein